MDEVLSEAGADPEGVVLLYEDEASVYRQPSQASLFSPRGRQQPRLSYACKANTVMRVAGFLNACTGALHFWDAARITAGKLAKCFKEIALAYPEHRRIYIVMDNWPVHFHPKVESVVIADPRIVVLRLPTYSPWLNPIEKLWRLTKQTVVHAHDMSDDFNQFKNTVRELLRRPTKNPQELLRYVGLATK